MMRIVPLLVGVSLSTSAGFANAADLSNATLEEAVVTATLRDEGLFNLPVSATVLDQQTLHGAGVQHVEDVLGLIPNLNWSAGTSRPRFYQLRGIGELDQYQGAPNPSVGFLIDDIDFSGIGMPATLFDVEQMEVLRGPQGTTYGANALGGLIKIRTRAPRPQFELSAEATGAEYNTQALGAVIGGPLGILESDSSFRLMAQKYESDGFRENVFLHRKSTNGYDELSTRAKARLDFNPSWRLDLTGLYVDQDNGYDAFSIDNSFITRSDRPGRDAQRSKAMEARLAYLGWSGMTVESISTYNAIDVHYSFDDDWGNNPFWADVANYSPYDYYSEFLRQRTVRSQEFRLSSNRGPSVAGKIDWVAGIYVLHLNETNSDLEFKHDLLFYPTPESPILYSDYRATNKAVYGQLDYSVTASTVFGVGARFENRSANYADSDNTAFAPSEDMLGGQLSVIHQFAPDHSVHATISRGYKAGGFNIGANVPKDQVEFSAEYLWNLEVGDRKVWLDDRLYTDVTLFYMRRTNQQVTSSTQLDPNDPSTFIFVTSNAAHGDNAGLESSATYRLAAEWQLLGSLAFLHTRYLGYQYVDPVSGELHDLRGRAQAHAPSYQYSLGLDWHRASGWHARVDATGMASFYFDTSHDQTSSARTLVNGRFGYETKTWSASLWGRNLFNTTYAVRGFYFGNEPPDFPNKLYIQRGDPRQIGVTVDWSLR
jgi:iron complex outermembrane receptor protein